MKFSYFMQCHLGYIWMGPKTPAEGWGKDVDGGDIHYWSVEKSTADCIDLLGMDAQVVSELGIVANKGNAPKFEIF